MDQKPKLMTPFDMLVTSSSLYTLKLMLPFTPASMQRSLAIYIKFSELKSTMEHFYGFRNSDCQGSILDQLKSCLSPEEQTQMSQMEDLMNMDGNDADYEFLIPMGKMVSPLWIL